MEVEHDPLVKETSLGRTHFANSYDCGRKGKLLKDFYRRNIDLKLECCFFGDVESLWVVEFMKGPVGPLNMSVTSKPPKFDPIEGKDACDLEDECFPKFRSTDKTPDFLAKTNMPCWKNNGWKTIRLPFEMDKESGHVKLVVGSWGGIPSLFLFQTLF